MSRSWWFLAPAFVNGDYSLECLVAVRSMHRYSMNVLVVLATPGRRPDIQIGGVCKLGAVFNDGMSSQAPTMGISFGISLLSKTPWNTFQHKPHLIATQKSIAMHCQFGFSYTHTEIQRIGLPTQHANKAWLECSWSQCAAIDFDITMRGDLCWNVWGRVLWNPHWFNE